MYFFMFLDHHHIITEIFERTHGKMSYIQHQEYYRLHKTSSMLCEYDVILDKNRIHKIYMRSEEEKTRRKDKSNS